MPRVTMFEPIFAGLHRKGLVSLSPTAIDKLLSVSVEDHSSDMHPPQRLWSFLDRSQVSELHAVLGEWLAEHT